MIKYTEFKNLVDSLVYYEFDYQFDEDWYTQAYTDFKEGRITDPREYIEDRMIADDQKWYNNFWLKSDKVSAEYIDELYEDQVFVFGSNMSGIHGAGAARMALKWGAVMGRWTGLNGSTYAIPTKDRSIQTLPLEDIEFYVDKFFKFAARNEDLTFLVTEIGCGLAGYEIKDIAPMFEHALRVDNVWIPYRFKRYLEEREQEINKIIKSIEVC